MSHFSGIERFLTLLFGSVYKQIGGRMPVVFAIKFKDGIAQEAADGILGKHRVSHLVVLLLSFLGPLSA